MNVHDICSYLDLDIDMLAKYTKDDIKQFYKKVALECHPDKLAKTTDENERQCRIDKFKNATIAYNQLLQDFERYGKVRDHQDFVDFGDIADEFEYFKDFDVSFWQDAFINIDTKNNIYDTFRSIASFFINKNLKPQSWYNPSINVIKHHITLPVSYSDLCRSKSKRVRLILKGIEEPLFINVMCNKEYPEVVKQYIDDDGMEHEIYIKMKILEGSCRDYSHILKDDGSINLVSNVDITWSEYLLGCQKELIYVDKQTLFIDIPAFSLDKIIVDGKGLMGGDLIIYLGMKHIVRDKWNMIKPADKDAFLKVLNSFF